ncbi:MAG: Ig-like domain-containing protein [Nitrospirota bacterium]
MKRMLAVVGGVAVAIAAVGWSASAAEPEGVQIVKTSPEYGKTIPSLSGLVVEITFDRPMDPATQDDVTMDQRGATDANGEPIEFNGTYTWVTPSTLHFRPDGTLKPDSVYQVTVWSATAKDGSELQTAPYRLPFSTSGAK